MPPVHTGFKTGGTTMAEVAIFHGPRNLAVVAGSAELSLADLVHRDPTRTGFRLEADIDMANGALKADAMKPVRIDDGRHTLPFRAHVNDHIPVFGPSRSKRHEDHHDQCEPLQLYSAPHCFGTKAPLLMALEDCGETLWQRLHSVSGNDTAP